VSSGPSASPQPMVPAFSNSNFSTTSCTREIVSVFAESAVDTPLASASATRLAPTLGAPAERVLKDRVIVFAELGDGPAASVHARAMSGRTGTS
jgi:hypothetical protein